MNVDKNNVISKIIFLIKSTNKITSFGFNWDYLGYYGLLIKMSSKKINFIDKNQLLK